MRLAAAISFALHAAAFMLMTTAWPFFSRRDDLSYDVVPVELVEIDDITRVVQKPEEAEPEPAPEPEPEVTPEPEPEPVEEVAQTIPEPEPEPVAEPEPKPVIPVTPKPVATPQPRPEPPAVFRPDRIAALIDKSKDEKAPPPQPAAKPVDLEAAVKRSQVASLEAQRNTATLIATMRRLVEKCWNRDVGALDADAMRVKVHFQLNVDGSLVGRPEFDTASQIRYARSDDIRFRVFAEGARRAVQRCAPYDLPREDYAQWQSWILHFKSDEGVQ